MNSFVYIVTYRKQLEVAPLKNLFFLAVFESRREGFLWKQQEIESMGKTFPTI